MPFAGKRVVRGDQFLIERRGQQAREEQRVREAVRRRPAHVGRDHAEVSARRQPLAALHAFDELEAVGERDGAVISARHCGCRAAA